MNLADKKIFVGMSGGVDSAVSALLLQRAGADVTGVFMKNFSAEIMVDGVRTPCWTPEWRDALRVAAHLHIPLVKFDFEKEYRREVLTYLYAEYEAGRTPNPDVLCNSAVKFGPFLAECLVRGADFIATGHYAQVAHAHESVDSATHLLRAADENKDQTYFLHQISRDALARTLFPVGHLTKPAVRALAREAGLPVAAKQDSTGICFVGDVSIKEFLRDKISVHPGNIVVRGVAGAPDRVIGQHDGLAWYTIGQRHGFGIGGGRPLYVAEKKFARNELVVAPEYDATLFTREIIFDHAHWINELPKNEKLFVRLRHRQPLQEIESLTPLDADANAAGHATRYKILTRAPQRAVTPGQFAVIYSATECFGGGVIE